MEQPLLGSETPDYETFPERPDPQQEQNYIRTLKNKRLFLATFAAVLGNFSFGYALVYTSPVIPALERSPNPALRMNKTESSWFGSVFTLGAAAGGLSAMVLNDLLGRKLSIMFSAVPSVIGYALMAGAQGLWMLLLGRILTGFAGGLTAACIPVYVSEISHPGVRGALGATPQIMAVFGSLLLYALGLKIPWRWLAVAGEVPVFVMMVLLCFMPNSPRFLLSQGKEEEALKALAWLRGRDTDFQREFQQIQNSVRRQPTVVGRAAGPFHLQAHRHRCSDEIPAAANRRHAHSGLPAIHLPQHGCAAAPRRRRSHRGGHEARVCANRSRHHGQSRAQDSSLCLRYARSAPCPLPGEGLGAPPSHLLPGLEPSSPSRFTASIMFVANLALGLYIHLSPQRPAPNATVALSSVAPEGSESGSYLMLVPLFATMLFIMGYAMGWGPITWLLMSEILPLKARGVASGLCVLVSWLTAFALTKSFLLVENAFGLQVPFYFFAAVCLINLVFTGCCVPETRRRSLEQIESFFRTGRRSFLR
ncbi:solute carrier family 2, facilitated glucose transporter member 6 isoform X1 [Antechinus flavipes]|uniref:solute carrier family 2, facilitated glucose transporter member 6 isoform X1 n=1 Tax=Antechinus flavipes TaxID=38775 RepID=UPI002236A757|nr:solute carrier family 2, facilitated glucose transporter member 6 isoform X1 [Antechinus flavipes]